MIRACFISVQAKARPKEVSKRGPNRLSSKRHATRFVNEVMLDSQVSGLGLRAGISPRAGSQADTFVGMYVNDWTLGFGPRGREAVRQLLARGHQAGVIAMLVEPEFVE